MDTGSLQARREFWKCKVEEWQNSKQASSFSMVPTTKSQL
jgi:hypothetical protein